MNILISNDDGWAAPGIEALLEVAESFGECTVVAPAHEQSGISHQISLHREMKLVKYGERAWSLEGTPADCIRVGLTQLKTSFDLVLSGINNGGNLGSDIYVSGTVAAAREAALFGVPAISISQHRLRFGEEFDWTNSKELAARVIKHCISSGLESRELVNVNLPDFSDSASIPEYQIIDPCPLDPAPRLAVFESESQADSSILKSVGKYNDRERSPGHDVATCFEKNVPITRLRF